MLALVLVAGCSEPAQAQVVAGSFDGGGWSAWVRQSFDQGLCLEIRALGRGTEGICGLEADATNTFLWQLDAPAGEDRFLAGIVSDGPAERARVRLRDGTVVDAPVVGTPDVTPLRFYVVVLPPHAEAVSVDLLDGSGTLVQANPIG